MIPVWPMDLSSAGHYHFSRKSASSPENQGKEQHAPLAQLVAGKGWLRPRCLSPFSLVLLSTFVFLFAFVFLIS